MDNGRIRARLRALSERIKTIEETLGEYLMFTDDGYKSPSDVDIMSRINDFDTIQRLNPDEIEVQEDSENKTPPTEVVQ